jgi:hypothetical protein
MSRLIGSAILLPFLSVVASAETTNESFSVVFEKERKWSVLRNGKEFITLDLVKYTTAGERLWGEERPELRPVSPDGQYIPLLIRAAGKDNFDILLLNLKDKTLKRQELYRNTYFHMDKLEWITPTKIGIPHRLPNDGYIIYDIVAESSELLPGEAFVVWDAKGENRASIHGKAYRYARGISRPDSIPAPPLVVSEALRYNGFWVYPESLEGFITVEEYLRWHSDIGVREYGKGKLQPPIIRTLGVAVARNHVLSELAFVAKTSWVGFFEQVFPLGETDKVLESNAVILDAHRVNTNPPFPEGIAIRKTPIPSMIPKEKAEYMSLVKNLFAKWNSETQCLELWKSDGNVRVKKLGHVPIDVSKMEMGPYTSENSDWIPRAY